MPKPPRRPPDTISVRELALVLRRRLGLVLTPLALALGLSTASLYVMTPTYRAVTTMVVTTPSGPTVNYDTLLYNRTLAKTYVEVARSRGVARAAIERLQLQEDAERFRERVTVSVVRDTEVIAIAVDDTDPLMAARLANTIGEIFRGEFAGYNSPATLRVIDLAAPPLKPIKPRPLLYTAIALASGITAGVGLALLGEHLRTTPPVAQVAMVASVPEQAAPAPPHRPTPHRPRRRFRLRHDRPSPHSAESYPME